MNKNYSSRGNNNILPRSKFHSIMSTNSGIPIDREERFKSPKKLTDQSSYFTHKTLDINNLPRREKYRYASFGFDHK